jgi:hypothetical protein
MRVTSEPSAPIDPTGSLLFRIFQFPLVVLWGMIAGVAADFFGCLAHLYRDGKVYVDLDSIHVFVFGVVGFAGMLAGSLWLLDKLIEFKRQKITFVVAFITAAVLSNYFYPSMCGSTP